jgi:hypothetical protein
VKPPAAELILITRHPHSTPSININRRTEARRFAMKTSVYSSKRTSQALLLANVAFVKCCLKQALQAYGFAPGRLACRLSIADRRSPFIT